MNNTYNIQMALQHVFNTKLQVNEDYLQNPGSALSLLEARYKGRCIKGAWIKSIDKIISQSECMVNQDVREMILEVKFQWLATIVEYAENDLITGIKISSVNDEFIMGIKDNVKIIYKNTKYTHFITENMILPFRILYSRMAPYSKEILLSVELFQPRTTTYVYEIDGSDNLEDCALLIKEAEKLAILYTPDARYEQIIFPFTNVPTLPAGKINILKDAFTSKYICLNCAHLSPTPMAEAHSDPSTFPPHSEIRKLNTPLQIRALLIQEYIERLRILSALITDYNTPELLTKHTSLWQFYKKNKKAY